MTTMWQPCPPPDAVPRRPRVAHATRAPGDDVIPQYDQRYSSERADCCIGPSAYRVVFRAGDANTRPTELFLCGHHYRTSTTVLLEVRATVYDAADRLLASFS